MSEATDGLAPERTHLAWQRTALSSLACSLGIARLLMSSSLLAALLVAGAAIAGTAFLAWLSVYRFRAHRLSQLTQQPATDARLHLALAGIVTIAGIGALVYVAS